MVIAVLGGYRVASGTMSLGDVQAFIQYSRQFTMPITQIADQMNMLQSGLASAERVFEFLDATEESADYVPVAAPTSPPPRAGQVSLDSSSPTGNPGSETPTRSSSWTTDASWNTATMGNCSRAATCTTPCTTASSLKPSAAS